MSWTVKYKKSVLKDFKKIDKHEALRIKEFIESKLVDCENPRKIGKPLKGNLATFWRYRVGSYRLICDIQDSDLVILILTAKHRKESY